MTEPLVAPVYEATLDDATLAALFRDLEALTTAVEVVLKRGAQRHGEHEPAVTLPMAYQLLVHREVRALQLRYTHEHKLWCDTLIASEAGTRIVRMVLPTASALA
jgi:hypothetical protein